MSWLLPLILAAVQATVVREGSDYALQAHDGRWLVCSADADRPRLIPEASVPANRTFTFVRVSGKRKRNTAYLRFGDVLLTAMGGKDRSDPLLGAQFQLLSRPADGKVALSSAAYSTLLRPGSLMNADGTVELEQGGDLSDEAVWWRLCTVAPDGSVSDAEANQQCAAELKPVQAASNGWWSPFGLTKGSEKEPRATSTSTVPDSKRKSKMSSSAFRAQPMAVQAARARSRSQVFAAAGALLVGTTAAMVPTTTLVQIAGGASAALRVGALSPLLRHSVIGSTLASTGQVVGSAFRWLAAHPAGRVLQRAVVAAASRIGTAASGAAVALGRARSEHELGSLLAVLSCLVFNTYLAVLSHSLPAADRPPDNEQQEQESVAAASHEQGSDSATQLLLRDW